MKFMDNPYEPAEARRAIAKPAAEKNVVFEIDALEEILSQTHGYPYFLQEWGKHTWEAASGSPITFVDVNRASQQAVAALDESFFRVRFDRMTPKEKLYVRAMADLGPGPHRSGDVANELARPVNALGPVRQSLIRKVCFGALGLVMLHLPRLYLTSL